MCNVHEYVNHARFDRLLPDYGKGATHKRSDDDFVKHNSRVDLN